MDFITSNKKINIDKNNIFWEIHLKWTPLMRNKATKVFGYALAEDIINDYLIYFMNFHFSHFNLNWEGDKIAAKEKNISIEEQINKRAKNFYIQRFYWYISKKCFYNKKYRKLYAVDNKEFSPESGENISTSLFYSGTSTDEDKNNFISFDGDVNGINILFDYKFENDFDIYISQLINFIEEHVEGLYEPTKQKILKFLKIYQKYKTVELNESFGTSTVQYRKLLGNLIKEFDDFLYYFNDNLKLDKVNFLYNIVY